MNKEYTEKFKDPRWQRKRLEILERDNWCCQRCYDDTKILHIHHCFYEKNHDPWDYPNDSLITLCEDCHENEKENRPYTEKWLLRILRKLFRENSLDELVDGFNHMELLALPEVVASVYAWAIENPNIQRELIDKYFKHLKAKQKVKKVK